MNRLLTELRCYKSEINDTNGIFTYHPLTPGYGITLGNSLRRVLLSSIPSCGISGIFIPGISHQYATIDGVCEDVIYIIQNLKQINFKFHSQAIDEHVVKIEFQGPGNITSADIHCDEIVEVLNKDIYICSVVDNIKFECNIYIKKGSGYLGLGSSEYDIEKKFAGFIPVNSIANAVKCVSFEITNINHAGRTDYEKLTLNITTDGNITPPEAIKQAADVLVNQFASISSSGQGIVNKVINNNSVSNEVENEEISAQNAKTRLLSSSIRAIRIPVKICAILEESGICFVGDLVTKEHEELLLIPKLGVRKLQEVEKCLHECGLDFKSS